jgi:hypothetical protein
MTEAESLAGQCRATRDRFAATKGPLLVVHDTTELSYRREDGRPIGALCKSHAGSDAIGRPRHQTVCGILMHSSLAVTTEGLPLGLAAMKFWIRRNFKGTYALKRIEQKKGSVRWLENVGRSTERFGEIKRCVHMGDPQAIFMNSSG